MKMGALARIHLFRMLKSLCQSQACFHGNVSVGRYLSTEARQNGLGVFDRVLHSFPDGVQMAFAYGSGVFQQSGHEMSKNMLDFVFVVEDPIQWHQNNLISHRKHYSFLASLGPKAIANYQENFGAGVYFNTLVPFEDRLIKYGVISMKRLLKDLIEWDSLYISGRLHKPVRMVKSSSDKEVQTALTQNLNCALHASLLLLPEKFTEEDLFVKITSLSYSGDFRMKFGEDKGKVRKIVTPNHQHFCDLYQSSIESDQHLHWDKSCGTFFQDVSSSSRLYHLRALPKCVVTGIQKSVKYISVIDSEEDRDGILRAVSNMKTCPQVVSEGLVSIVNQSSWSQSLKGLVTAGLVKSTQYSSKKLLKMFKGLKES